MNGKTNEFERDVSVKKDVRPSTFVKWTEKGVTQRGTVTGTLIKRGKKYLNVMSILGKRHILRRSQVKPVIAG
ncbi:MAG TPA: hypothetical protein VK213_09455 [Bacteroidales bacterium]|nr:hypothetical protein [Bacteroidales bacterium]